MSIARPTATVMQGTDIVFHPLYNWSNAERTGYDFAIVRLDGPIEDAGPPPALYGGNREDGARIVMVGWGSRGIGSVGQKPKYYTTPGKAAADQQDRRGHGRRAPGRPRAAMPAIGWASRCAARARAPSGSTAFWARATAAARPGSGQRAAAGRSAASTPTATAIPTARNPGSRASRACATGSMPRCRACASSSSDSSRSCAHKLL